ncbi:MAG: hypothetical protein LBS61_02590 [Endomicrobium sp.]|jgi:beta-glucuronidase|nr:hypothetical protein [Endomicrobium sp.]
MGTPWYIAPLCVGKIKYLTKKHPEFKIMLEGASVRIENRFDNDRNNDRFYVNPGKLVLIKRNQFKRKRIDLTQVFLSRIRL